MNRVLSWPQTRICPGLLKPLKEGRHATQVTFNGTVRFELPLGNVEMTFLNPAEGLEPLTEVVVWWKGGGFVCATQADLEAEARVSQSLSSQLHEARARLQAARHERLLRDSAMAELDALPPQAPRPDFPLLRA
jgi:hypothetical protein